MTLRADIDLALRRPRLRAARRRTRRVASPGDAVALVQLRCESSTKIVGCVLRVAARVRQCDVLRARSMTCFAADRNLRPASLEAIRLRVVILVQCRRMTIGTHVVPILCGSRPMQLVGVIDVLLWVQMEP